MSVVIEGEDNARGLAFVMHGLGGWKNQPHIKVFAEAFLKNGFTVVRFDTTNTFGESEGNYEDATTTNYYEDLEDIILLANQEKWYKEPFWLAGHSLGGLCTALYAEKHPEKVAGLAPISTVVSGKLSIEAGDIKELKEWERTGWRVTSSESVPGLIKKLKWSHMIDRLNYDLLPKASMLTMPVLLVVGEYDDRTPPAHQQLLLDALTGPKEMHIIKGAPHTFRELKHLAEIEQLFDKWIQRV